MIRRKRRDVGTPIPEHLQRFKASEWPGNRHDALHAWKDARKKFYDDHPDAWRDWLDMMDGYVRERALLIFGRLR